MELTTLLGLLAGTLTTGCLVPQVVQAARTRKTRDLSLPMMLLMDMGILLWLAYGLLLGEAPLIAANLAAAVLASALVALKLRFG